MGSWPTQCRISSHPSTVGLPIILLTLSQFKAPIHIGFLSGLDLKLDLASLTVKTSAVVPITTMPHCKGTVTLSSGLPALPYYSLSPSRTCCYIHCNLITELMRGREERGEGLTQVYRWLSDWLRFLTQPLPSFPYHHVSRDSIRLIGIISLVGLCNVGEAKSKSRPNRKPVQINAVS